MVMRQSFILAFLSVTLLGFVTLVEGGNTVHCSFDHNHCLWREEKGKHCWRVSQPGQSLAGMKSYLYFDKACSNSSEIKTKPQKGFFFIGREEEFHFSYYMHGEGDGNLVIVSHDTFERWYDIPPQTAFHCKGDRGDQWHHAHVKVPSQTTFMGIIANTTGSFSIAVDDITADSHGGVVPKKQFCPPTRTTFKRSTRFTTAATTTTNVKTTATKSASTTATKVITAIKTKSPSSTSRSKSDLESTTPDVQKIRSTTLLVDINTKKAITTKGRGYTPTDARLNLKAKSGNPHKTSIIVGSCVGAVVVLIGLVLALYFSYRRFRLSSMYSFKREEL